MNKSLIIKMGGADIPVDAIIRPIIKQEIREAFEEFRDSLKIQTRDSYDTRSHDISNLEQSITIISTEAVVEAINDMEWD